MSPLFRLFLSALIIFSWTASTYAADDNPESNGKKMSEWIESLKEEKLVRKRKAALINLGQIASAHQENSKVIRDVIIAVGRSLKDDASPSVRHEAAVILGQQKFEAALDIVPELTQSLRSETDTATKRETAAALGRFGKHAKEALSPLTAALKDTDAGVRAAAANTLGRIGADATPSTPDLLPLLKDKDKTVRQAAVFAIGRMEPQDKIPSVNSLLEMMKTEQEDELRRELLTSIGLLNETPPEAVDAVAALITDKEAELRREAVLTITKFGPPARSCEKTLAEALKTDKDKQVRIFCVRALGAVCGTNSADLIPMLSERLKADKDFEVRVAIAEEMGSMGLQGKAALPALREAQRDTQIKVREAASSAIKQIDKGSQVKNP